MYYGHFMYHPFIILFITQMDFFQGQKYQVLSGSALQIYMNTFCTFSVGQRSNIRGFLLAKAHRMVGMLEMKQYIDNVRRECAVYSVLFTKKFFKVAALARITGFNRKANKCTTNSCIHNVLSSKIYQHYTHRNMYQIWQFRGFL